MSHSQRDSFRGNQGNAIGEELWPVLDLQRTEAAPRSTTLQVSCSHFYFCIQRFTFNRNFLIGACCLRTIAVVIFGCHSFRHLIVGPLLLATLASLCTSKDFNVPCRGCKS
jgi:hypothetical protein